MSMASNSCYITFSLFPGTYNLMGSSIQSADRGRENLGLTYRQFGMICRHHPKGGSCSTKTPFWDVPEGQW